MSMLLTVDQITRGFGRKPVLHGLRFCLRRGEVLGLLGPNGAGKTTALRILAGILSPSSGRVLVNGTDLQQAPQSVKARLGYLPERSPIYPEMRVDEYLTFAGRLHRIAAGELPDALARVKAACGLTHVGQRLLGQLSKGYQQRAGIAQALIHRPDLVILDEPADGLDPVQIRELRGLIRSIAENAGVILSSHALTEVQAICSRAIILHQGRQLHDADLKAQATAAREVQVRLRPPPVLSSVLALPPVESAKPCGKNRLRIRLREDASADLLARALMEHGYGLLELRPCHTDLEQVFFGCIGLEPAA
ncbi:ABC transporter ATP-binding protein [Halochromatium sp.]